MGWKLEQTGVPGEVFPILRTILTHEWSRHLDLEGHPLDRVESCTNISDQGKLADGRLCCPTPEVGLGFVIFSG